MKEEEMVENFEQNYFFLVAARDRLFSAKRIKAMTETKSVTNTEKGL